MGNQPSSGQIVSNEDNDYNPFNIPRFELNSPSEFNGSIAVSGCPPFHNRTKSQFANLPIETQAAYADGVVRGSYQKDWLKNQSDHLPDAANDSAVGAIAYMYLKTHDQKLLSELTAWNERNKNNHNKF